MKMWNIAAQPKQPKYETMASRRYQIVRQYDRASHALNEDEKQMLHPNRPWAEYTPLPRFRTDGSGLAAYFVSLIENSITWKDLEWLKSLRDLPLLIKGVVRSDDAETSATGELAS